MEFQTIGFIGGGNMSSAVGQAIIKNNLHPISNIWVSGPNLHNLKKWQDYGVNVTRKNADIIQNCDIIFLGVKPQMFEQAINECLNDNLSIKMKCRIYESKLFISMLAGVRIKHLKEVISKVVDNFRVIRTMPNTPMLIGEGVCIYTPDSDCNEQDCQFLEKILDKCGIYEKVSEPMIDSTGTLSGCGTAFVYMVIEAMADGAVKQGVARATAIRLAAQTVAGSARMVLNTGHHPAQLKDEVCSPGGSTICGIAALESGGVRSSFINAIETSTKRNKELGNLNLK